MAATSAASDSLAFRKLLLEERRDGIAPHPLAAAAEEAVAAWLRHEHETNPGWWPSWEEMDALEKEHRGNPLTEVIRRICGLQYAPLSQVLDTLRFKYHVCGPWRSRALRKLSQAREALQCATEDDVPAAATGARERLGRAEGELAEAVRLLHLLDNSESRHPDVAQFLDAHERRALDVAHSQELKEARDG
jgi:hypothetical protein